MLSVLHLSGSMSRASSVLACALVSTLSLPLAAQGPMRVGPSGRATTEVTLTFVDSAARAATTPSTIRIDYGQPHLRGRTLNTDSLVPYDKAWRTGANGATMLTTTVDLTIGGASVPKGTYVVQTLPSRTGWKLLIQRDMGASPMAAAMAYKPENDVARIDLRQTRLESPLESLSMWLIPTPGTSRGELRIAWGTVALATDWSVK
jgi:hypothetical protein